MFHYLLFVEKFHLFFRLDCDFVWYTVLILVIESTVSVYMHIHALVVYTYMMYTVDGTPVGNFRQDLCC